MRPRYRKLFMRIWWAETIQTLIEMARDYFNPEFETLPKLPHNLDDPEIKAIISELTKHKGLDDDGIKAQDRGIIGD